MNKKSKYLFLILVILSVFLFSEIFILSSKKFDISKKEEFIRVTAMPDLAISTETIYIRNRSLSDIFSIYKDDPTLIEYFPSTFVYNIEIKE